MAKNENLPEARYQLGLVLEQRNDHAAAAEAFAAEHGHLLTKGHEVAAGCTALEFVQYKVDGANYGGLFRLNRSHNLLTNRRWVRVSFTRSDLGFLANLSSQPIQ
mgnify:CR=1 FL=1